MKLRNKQTGEIIETIIVDHGAEWEVRNVYTDEDAQIYNSLAELNAEWCDYEEPKGINEIDVVLDAIGEYCNEHSYYSGDLEKIKILNTVEEKLKAWKRLKDKGFRFTGFTHKDRGRLDELEIYCQLGECPEDIEDMEDVRLLFGGEE